MQADNKLLTGSVLRGLLTLALPILAANVLQTAFNLVDTWFVSRLGQEAIAAVSMNLPVFFIVLALGNAVAIGTSSLVAQAVGAGDRARANRIAGQAMALSLTLGIFSGIVGTALARPLLELMGGQGLSLDYAVAYTQIILAGNPVFFFYMALDGVLRGEGDMKSSTLILGFATVINIFLDPLFIFGLGPVPALGVAGAALATMLARGIGLILIISHFYMGRSSIVLRFRFSWDWEVVGSIMRIGFPSSISMAMLSLTMFVYNYLANQFGPHVVAALGLGFRIDSLAFMPGQSISIATLTMIGQNYGARLYDRVVQIWKTGLLAALVSLGSVAIVVLLVPEFFVSLFTDEPDVFDATVSYLRIVPLFYVFLGLGIVTSSSFQGLGRALPALVINLFRLGLVGIPLAFVLIRTGLGASGIWWALALSDLTFASIGFFWFSRLLKKGLSKPVLPGSPE